MLDDCPHHQLSFVQIRKSSKSEILKKLIYTPYGYLSRKNQYCRCAERTTEIYKNNSLLSKRESC